MSVAGSEEAATASSAFRTADPPRWEDYSRCTHCGLCLQACPTFRLLGEEMDSPRGRIYQVAQADAGRLPLAGAFETHIGRCLDCRACETACPSGVEYGKILERARGELAARRRLGGPQAWLSNYVFERLLPDPKAMARIARALRWYQRGGPRAVARATGLLRGLGLAGAESLAPEIESRFFTAEMGQTFPAQGPRRARVAFLAGCIQRVAFAEMNRATIRVLQAAGCEVVVPAGQTCCGALHVHAGRRAEARRLARTNIQAFGGVDAVVTNSAGCGSALKEYGDLLGGEAAAADFAGRVRDATELLAALGLPEGMLGPLPLAVTYQDPCHLAHGQRIRSAPRQLLAAIPELRLVEMDRADSCCGSAGIYNVVQPDIAGRLLAEKMVAVEATGADTIVTANPGCMLQLRAGLRQSRRPGQVWHLMELLDQARRQPGPPI
ncbi:MAG: (Fe-S)-binding protein [Terriglobales bacterium]